MPHIDYNHYSKLTKSIKKNIVSNKVDKANTTHSKVSEKRSSLLIPFENRKTNLYGFINDRNIFVIPAIYDSAVNFKGNLAFVKKGNFWEAIDRNGNQLTNLRLQRVPYISERGYFINEIGENQLTVFNNVGKEILNSKNYFSSFSNIRQFVIWLDLKQEDEDLILRVLMLYSDLDQRYLELMNLSSSFTEIKKGLPIYLLEMAYIAKSKK